MPRAVLTVRIPDGVWIGEVTRRHPGTVLRVLAAFPDGDRGIAMVEVGGEDVDGVLGALRDVEEVLDLEPLGRPGPEALARFETTEPLLLGPVLESGTLLDLPFEIQDGRARWEVTATSDRLSALGDRLRDLDIEFEVESVTEGIETDRLLTERQAALIETAVEAGYYDTPRDCTLTDLAERAGIAKSTTSETLHRAEGKIVKRFIERW